MPGIARSPRLPHPPPRPLPLRPPPLPAADQLLGGLLAGPGAQPLHGADASASLLPAVRLLALGSTTPTGGGSWTLRPLHLREEGILELDYYIRAAEKGWKGGVMDLSTEMRM